MTSFGYDTRHWHISDDITDSRLHVVGWYVRSPSGLYTLTLNCCILLQIKNEILLFICLLCINIFVIYLSERRIENKPNSNYNSHKGLFKPLATLYYWKKHFHFDFVSNVIEVISMISLDVHWITWHNMGLPNLKK